MSFVYSHPFTGLSNGLQTINAAGGAVGGWVELGRTTLGSAGDTISVSSLADKRYYMVLSDLWASGANINVHARLNNDSGSNYAQRESTTGGADATATNQTELPIDALSIKGTVFGVSYLANLSSKEKLWISHDVGNDDTFGSPVASTAPYRTEAYAKWANTSNAVNRIDVINTGSADFRSGSEAVILGWDPADTHTNNFWEELASVEGDNTSATLSTGTFTSKKYLWIQGYGAVASGSANIQLRVGNTTLDSGSNYSFRYNDDGGTDGTGTSQTALVQHQLTGNGYFNCFIVNNASNEKLGISHHIFESASGAGTAPQRQEQVGKWANTSNQIDIVGMVEGSGSSKNWVSPSILKVWGAD